MGVFDPITLTWAGVDYVIPANRVMGAIARIEDVVTLEELSRYGERGTMPIAKLAMAYGALLRYAGAKVEDEDVFAGLFRDADKQADIVAAMTTLFGMMLPPRLESGAPRPPSRQADQAAPASSRKPTRRPSAEDG